LGRAGSIQEQFRAAAGGRWFLSGVSSAADDRDAKTCRRGLLKKKVWFQPTDKTVSESTEKSQKDVLEEGPARRFADPDETHGSNSPRPGSVVCSAWTVDTW